MRHVMSLEINIEEILASFVFRFEVSHVSEDISKKMGQKSCLDCKSKDDFWPIFLEMSAEPYEALKRRQNRMKIFSILIF